MRKRPESPPRSTGNAFDWRNIREIMAEYTKPKVAPRVNAKYDGTPNKPK